jgi:hypothetical protein
LPDLFLVTDLPPSTLALKVADEDKAGGGNWGRREGQGIAHPNNLFIMKLK